MAFKINLSHKGKTLKLETEDYCDQRLASFEALLNKTIRIVSDGRTKLQGDPLADLTAAHQPQESSENDGPNLYDQDESGSNT